MRGPFEDATDVTALARGILVQAEQLEAGRKVVESGDGGLGHGGYDEREQKRRERNPRRWQLQMPSRKLHNVVPPLCFRSMRRDQSGPGPFRGRPVRFGTDAVDHILVR